MKSRTINLKEGEVLRIAIDGVEHVIIMRSADGEWINVETRARTHGIDSSARAENEIARALEAIQ